MLLALDLRPEDVGAVIAFGQTQTIRGVLTDVNQVGPDTTILTVDGHPYIVEGDTLVYLDVPTELRIGGTPGRTGVWERANRVANMRLLMGALASKPRDDR